MNLVFFPPSPFQIVHTSPKSVAQLHLFLASHGARLNRACCTAPRRNRTPLLQGQLAILVVQVLLYCRYHELPRTLTDRVVAHLRHKLARTQGVNEVWLNGASLWLCLLRQLTFDMSCDVV